MTEYWVSQGNKWCEYCRIYIQNNAVSLRTHELGERHKGNVAKRLSNVQKNQAMQERDKLKAMKEMEHIEAKAVKSYHNDVKASYSAASTPTLTSSKLTEPKSGQHTYSGKSTVAQRAEADQAKAEWLEDAKSGYQYNATTGHYYDPKSGFYYSDVLGQWTTEEQALRAAKTSTTKASGPPTRKPPPPSTSSATVSTTSRAAQPLQPALKGRPSSFDVASHKRKREGKGTGKRMSSEEAAALAAREAARKRVQEREKSSMGLYQAY